MGLSLIRVKGSYSCFSLPDSERVVKRGLIKDNKDRIFNADAVGAYNILRLYIQNTGKTGIRYSNLSSLNKVTV